MSTASVRIHEFDHTPNYKTLTSAGRSHFTRISDALAEFIDNAIQATSRPSLPITFRSIQIKIFLSLGYIVISDNGCGMDLSDLQVFATYSLDQEDRLQQPKPGDTSFISKFGVGAKEAGFYLANRIRIISNKSLSSGLVYDYCMDEGDYQRRQREGHRVFVGRSMERPIDDHAHISSIEELEVLQHLPTTRDATFTHILLDLRAHILDKLISTYLRIPNELSEIYRFQLCPELLPNQIVQLERFQKIGKLSQESFPLPFIPKNDKIPMADLKPLKILYIVESDGKKEESVLNIADGILYSTFLSILVNICLSSRESYGRSRRCL